MTNEELVHAAQVALEVRAAALTHVSVSPPLAFQATAEEIHQGKAAVDIFAWLKAQEPRARRPALYTIEASTDTLARVLVGEFADASATKDRGYSLPRLNRQDGKILYVGGSENLRARLAQHLG
jgi:hypothetical protein